jgi:hypothetical protein
MRENQARKTAAGVVAALFALALLVQAAVVFAGGSNRASGPPPLAVPRPLR